MGKEKGQTEVEKGPALCTISPRLVGRLPGEPTAKQLSEKSKVRKEGTSNLGERRTAKGPKKNNTPHGIQVMTD